MSFCWSLRAQLSGVAITLLAAAGLGCESARGAPTAVAADVPFDHEVHAGKYEIPCLYCHSYADKARIAGIPSVRKCMGCHKFAAKDKEGVQKLAKMLEETQSPSWQRVYDVPDYVYFSHRVHVRAKVECEACHGAVKTMKEVVRTNSHEMGFCMRCHRERKVSLDCLACHK